MREHKTVKIYGLMDPRTNEIRYIGKTAGSLANRLKGHMNDKGTNKHKVNWIKSVITSGTSPEIFEIERVGKDDWQEAEIFWIAYFKNLGAKLTNATVGGDGLSSECWTPEMRHRVSIAQKDRPLTEEHKQALRKANANPAVKARRSKAQKGHEVSKKARKKLREANLGKTHSDESKEKMSLSQKGKPKEKAQNRTAEENAQVSANISEAVKGKKKQFAPGAKEAAMQKMWETRRALGKDGHSEETKQLLSEIKSNKPNMKKRLYHTYKGETLSMIEWSEKTGVKLSKIRGRAERGWPAEMVFADDETARVYKGQRISESKKNKPNGLKGVKIGPRSEEAKQNMSLAQKKYYASGGEPWNKGKKRSKSK